MSYPLLATRFQIVAIRFTRNTRLPTFPCASVSFQFKRVTFQIRLHLFSKERSYVRDAADGSGRQRMQALVESPAQRHQHGSFSYFHFPLSLLKFRVLKYISKFCGLLLKYFRLLKQAKISVCFKFKLLFGVCN